MLGGMAMAVGSMHMHTVFECSSSVAKVNLTTSMAFSSVEFVLYCLPILATKNVCTILNSQDPHCRDSLLTSLSASPDSCQSQ